MADVFDNDSLEIESPQAVYTPVIPMRDILIFPQMIAPVFISRPQSVIAVDNALLTEEHNVIMLAQKDPANDEPNEDDLYEVGILGKVVQVLKFPDGTIKALAEGIQRVKINELVKQGDFLAAIYQPLDDKEVDDDDSKALVKLTLDSFKNFLQRTTKISAESFMSVNEIKDAGKLSDILATYLNIELKQKQDLLETLNTYERLEKVSLILSREIEMQQIEENIQEKVKFKLGKTQKEYILKEKLRAIKEELGPEEGGDEIDEYREKIKKAKVPPKVKLQLEKELVRLERMPGYSTETAVIRTYMDTVLELPWEKKSQDKLDIKRARKILDEDHYGLQDVKERILEFLAVKKLSKEKQATIICFAGPPGVGKTSLARSIARSLNRHFAQVSLGGINDESEIRGHRRTYVGSMPGRIIRAMQDASTKNPVILLDEIEKMIPSHMGDPAAAMLEVLDPAQNNHYVDHYVDMPFDLSEVFFIATANSLERLYKPLRDRLEIITISSYTEEEKLNIATRFLMPRQFKLNGVDPKMLIVEDSALSAIINLYTRESGVRELERTIGKLCRKFAVKYLLDKETRLVITEKNIAEYLGTPKFVRPETEKLPQVGLVHGLAWTEVGGEILEIEASIMPGKGNLNLTGRLGEVMQESAKAAFSYVRSNHKKLDLPADIQEKNDIHIHAADGATPKDGPSAGIGLTLAIISAFTGRPVRSDLAMTGEITLRGNVLPIGGLKEKCIAALRNNITNVIIPKGNEKDLADMPDYIKDKIQFKIVERMDEVIDFALLKAEKEAVSSAKKSKKSK